jgi:hypothetical protein
LITADVFHQKFCCGIQVIFNWRRFFLENWPVTDVSLASPSDLSSLRLPWYRNEGGKFVAFSDTNASPVALANVSEWYPLLPSNEIAKIAKMKDEYVRGVNAPQFDFPSYALPDDRYMVLDANHRLCGLAMAGVPFSLRMWVVNGPIDPAALADTTFLFSARS